MIVWGIIICFCRCKKNPDLGYTESAATTMAIIIDGVGPFNTWVISEHIYIYIFIQRIKICWLHNNKVYLYVDFLCNQTLWGESRDEHRRWTWLQVWIKLHLWSLQLLTIMKYIYIIICYVEMCVLCESGEPSLIRHSLLARYLSMTKISAHVDADFVRG